MALCVNSGRDATSPPPLLPLVLSSSGAGGCVAEEEAPSKVGGCLTAVEDDAPPRRYGDPDDPDDLQINVGNETAEDDLAPADLSVRNTDK